MKTAAVGAGREQSRARYPDQEGYVERDGVRVFYERYGEGEPTVMFVPPWALVHSRCWKMQIPYFGRLFDQRHLETEPKPPVTQAALGPGRLP